MLCSSWVSFAPYGAFLAHKSAYKTLSPSSLWVSYAPYRAFLTHKSTHKPLIHDSLWVSLVPYGAFLTHKSPSKPLIPGSLWVSSAPYGASSPTTRLLRAKITPQHPHTIQNIAELSPQSHPLSEDAPLFHTW